MMLRTIAASVAVAGIVGVAYLAGFIRGIVEHERLGNTAPWEVGGTAGSSHRVTDPVVADGGVRNSSDETCGGEADE